MSEVFTCRCGRTVQDEEGERLDYLCPDCKTDWWLHPLKKQEKQA